VGVATRTALELLWLVGLMLSLCSTTTLLPWRQGIAGDAG